MIDISPVLVKIVIVEMHTHRYVSFFDISIYNQNTIYTLINMFAFPKFRFFVVCLFESSFFCSSFFWKFAFLKARFFVWIPYWYVLNTITINGRSPKRSLLITSKGVIWWAKSYIMDFDSVKCFRLEKIICIERWCV